MKLQTLLLFLLTAAGMAHGAEALPTLPENFTQRKMRVQVLDAESGQGIADVKVSNSSWYFLAGNGESVRLPEPATDAKGRVEIDLNIPPVEGRGQFSDFNLSLEHATYAPRTVAWHSDGGGVFDDVPSEYTVRLRKGVSIGGMVQDDQKQPLAGAQVIINAYGNPGFSTGTGEKRVQEYSLFNSGGTDPMAKNRIVTDREGRWSVSNFPADLEGIRITAVRDDGSDATYSTRSERFGFSRNDRPLLLPDLRAGAALLTVPSGFPVHGRILTAEGLPVPGAKVIEAYGMGNRQVRGTTTTDAEGRVEFSNRRARQCFWTVDAAGYALASEVVDLKAGMPERVMRVQRAQPAVLRVWLEPGKPAAGANVQVPDWRNDDLYVQFNGKTDASGTLVWSNAPLHTVRALVTVPAKNMRYVTLEGGKEQKLVISDTPENEIRVSVRASAAKDHVPVPAFELQIDKSQFRQFTPWCQSSNGVAQGVVRLADFRQGMAPQFRVRVHAPGFLPKESDLLDFYEGNQELEFALDKDMPLKGVVQLPDGMPAEGAYLVINHDPGAMFLNQMFQRGPVKPPSWGNLTKVQATAEGAYTLEGIDENSTVVVLHDAGYAQIPSKELRVKDSISLRPWERLEGDLKIGEQAAKAGERVGLTTMGGGAGALGIHFDATTDDAGHFAFDRLPAGSFTLFRYIVNTPGTMVFSHAQPVEIVSGTTTHVEMGGRGVRVEGKAKPSHYVDVDWTQNKHTLTAKAASDQSVAAAGPAWEDFVRRADFEAANRGRTMNAPFNRQYLLTFDKDGSFFVDDVEPGEYTLEIKVTEPPPGNRRWMEEGKLIGAVSTNLVVVAAPSSGLSKMQAGTFVLPIASVASSGVILPEFRVHLLDGKPVMVGGKKPAPEAILLWAPWSQKSCEALAQFQQSTSRWPMEKLRALAVAVEENQREIEASAQASSWKGPLAKLSGEELTKVFVSHGLDELPLLLVLDQSGQVLTKTSNMARLSDALSEVVAASNVKP